jgi:GDP-D-mannose 3',5'-epimerase
MDIRPAKIIVTGGAGFIGSALVKRLVAGGSSVTVLDNLWRGGLENLRIDGRDYAIELERDFHLADLTDYSVCLASIRDAELVYHLADIVGGVHFALKEQTFVFRQNILINTNVLSACLENCIPNYIYVGTACSYPQHLQMADGISVLREEQTYPANPESAYGWSKLMGEYEAGIAQRTGRINVGLLRLHNVYGPGVSFEPDRAQVIPALIRKAILYPAEPFVVWGDGNQYRDFIYVDDVVDALLLMADKGMNRDVLQVGSGNATSIRDLARLIVEISGKPITPAFDISQPQGDRGRIADWTRAREILGWSWKTDLTTGLQQTYDWISRRNTGGAQWPSMPALRI